MSYAETIEISRPAPPPMAASTPKMNLKLSQNELNAIVNALASYTVADKSQASPFLKALKTFRILAPNQTFEVSVDDIEAALQSLGPYANSVPASLRNMVENLAADLACRLLAPSTRSRSDRASNDVILNRHPIYQLDLNVVAYELQAERQPDYSRPSDGGDTQTIVDRFSGDGIGQFTGSRTGFVKMPWSAITGGHYRTLDKERTVIEVPDNVQLDAALFDALARLHNRGYRLAISDLLVRKSDFPLAKMAHVIKLDLADLGRMAVEARIEDLKGGRAKLLAEHVNSHNDFEFASDVGFDYLQGYFFCEPQVTGDQVPLNRLATMRLLARLQDPTINVAELEEVISEDLPLAYKLLRFANSAFVGLNRPVESIGHAAAMVGIERIRTWASLLMFSRMEDKPRELMITAVVRARMCEMMAEAMGRENPATFFTAGLFSVLDAVLDCPMSLALDLLPLSDEICQALLNRKGLLGETLRTVIAYERTDWDGVKMSRMTPRQIRECYVGALDWTSSHADGLGI